MNQIQFETSKVFGVFVKDITPEFTKLYPQYSHYLNQGFVSELTDQQKEEVVEKTKYGWINYNHNQKNILNFSKKSISESFASLLTSLNVLLVNPCGIDEPELNPVCCGLWQDDGYGNPRCCGVAVPCENSMQHQYLWQTAQQHVGNYILLTCNK